MDGGRKNQMINQREKIVQELDKAPTWLTVTELMKRIRGSCDSTIARALRHLQTQGKVIGKKIDGHKNGRKKWRSSKYQTASVSTSPTNTVPQRVTKMAAPNKPTLVAAVESLLTNEFLATNKKFSAYDVTARLRELIDVNSQSLPAIDTNETGTVYVHGRRIPRVEHEDVRDTIHEFYQQGKMTGYFRIHNGQYFEYEFPTPAAPDPTSDPGTTGTDGSSYDGSSTI